MPNIDTRLQKTAAFLLVSLPILLLVLGKAAMDVAATLIAVLFLAHVFITRETAWLKNTWVRLLLLFWAYVLLSTPLAEQPIEALKHGFTWGRYFFFAIAIAYWLLPGDKKLSEKLVFTIGIFVLCLSADALLQHYTGTDIIGKPKFQNNYRLTGPYNRPIVGAFLIWLMLPALLGLWQHPFIQQRNWIRYGAMPLLCALGYITVALSGERGPFLLALLSVPLIGFLVPRMRKAVLIGTFVAVVIGGLISLKDPVFYDRQVASSVKVISNLPNTIYGKIWLDAVDIGKANWITGVGARHYRVECNSVETAPTLRVPCELHPHNMYLELFAETGIIGFSLILAALSSVLYGFWRTRAHWQSDMITLGIFVTFLLRIWPLIASPSFFNSISAVPFWLMVGWGMGRIGTRD